MDNYEFKKELEYKNYHFRNMNKPKPDDINFTDYGRFNILLELMDTDNKIKYKNNKNVLSGLLLSLECKSVKTFKNFIYNLSKSGILAIDKDFIYINPVYAKKLNINLSVTILNLFKVDISENIKLFIKDINSNDVLLEVKKFLTDSEFESLNFKINKDCYYKVFNYGIDEEGIYILYKQNLIIYIGKSKNISSRVSQHKKDKDFDSVKSICFTNTSYIDLYEPFLINKYKPILNNDLIRDCSNNILPNIGGI